MDLFELTFLTLPRQVMHLRQLSSDLHSQVAHLALKSKRVVKYWYGLPREVTPPLEILKARLGGALNSDPVEDVPAYST